MEYLFADNALTLLPLFIRDFRWYLVFCILTGLTLQENKEVWDK